MKRALLVIALLFVATPAFAQAPAHSGFTVFANLGVGFQNDTFYEETATGLAGLNFGAGWFVTERMAVMGRFSGTVATFEAPDPDLSQASGVWAGTIQYWINRWASVEVGGGYGTWRDENSVKDNGFGLVIGFHASVFQKGAHHIRAGFEYAPVFTDSAVHNMGVVVGYQYAK